MLGSGGLVGDRYHDPHTGGATRLVVMVEFDAMPLVGPSVLCMELGWLHM